MLQQKTTSGGRQYLLNIPKHRGGDKLSSCWAISLQEELSAFENAEGADWRDAVRGCFWGLHPGEPGLLPVGTRDEHIAKFVTDSGETAWHGYPTSPARSDADVPCKQVLDVWCADGYISRVLMRRILGRKKCQW